jgi:hypothetical protein
MSLEPTAAAQPPANFFDRCRDRIALQPLPESKNSALQLDIKALPRVGETFALVKAMRA